MIYKHLLVAIDMADDCNFVLGRATALARHCQAPLSVVHVLEPLTLAFGSDVPLDISELQEAQLEEIRQRLHVFIERHPELDPVRCHLVFGQPRQAIHELAQAQGCDLIITGSHGRHGLSLLLGSTSNDLLHGATCDVLAVHLDK